jgi:MYXO-CTERM domain-containing protein
VTPPVPAFGAVQALGVEPDGRLAYALAFPLRTGGEAAVFWLGVLAAAWHLIRRRSLP